MRYNPVTPFPGSGSHSLTSMGKMTLRGGISRWGLAAGAVGLFGASKAMQLGNRIRTAATHGGTVGYGKRGIDANAHGADGLVQGLSRRRRG